MSPRPYRLGQRQAATEQTRARILTAARELLAESSGFSGFSIDTVAHKADVARMTIYHQFGSKIGLLEALSDFLAAYGGMEQLAALDPDFEHVIRARDERRRQGLGVIVRRLAEQHGQPAPEALDEVINVLFTLIGFECFDTLAGPTRSIQEVAPVVQQLAHAAIGLYSDRPQIVP